MIAAVPKAVLLWALIGACHDDVHRDYVSWKCFNFCGCQHDAESVIFASRNPKADWRKSAHFNRKPQFLDILSTRERDRQSFPVLTFPCGHNSPDTRSCGQQTR